MPDQAYRDWLSRVIWHSLNYLNVAARDGMLIDPPPSPTPKGGPSWPGSWPEYEKRRARMLH